VSTAAGTTTRRLDPGRPRRRSCADNEDDRHRATSAGAVGIVIGGDDRVREISTSSTATGGYPYQCDQRDDESLLTAGYVTSGASLVALGVGSRSGSSAAAPLP
jgi:hypothetical protein